MKKRVFIIISFIFVLLSVNAYIWAIEKSKGAVRFLEPDRGAEVPAHLVWNVETGAYYDPSEFAWDSEKKVYVDLTVKSTKLENVVEEETVEEWIKRNEGSDSPLIQAIIHFYHEREQNKSQQEVFSSNLFTESTKKALHHIVELGPSYTEEIISLIDSNSRWSPILAYSLLEIHEIPDVEHPVVSFSEAGMKQWVSDFRRLQLKAE